MLPLFCARHQGARAWAVPNGWMDESQPNSVLARHQPLELLEEMRVAAVTQIEHIAGSGRLLVSRQAPLPPFTPPPPPPPDVPF